MNRLMNYVIHKRIGISIICPLHLIASPARPIPAENNFEAILKSAEAFAVTFQGGADVLQDDVARASELIGNIRSQLQDLSSDENHA